MCRYGHLTWEWAPETQLRGYAHPLLFAALYKLLALLGLDGSTAVMVYAPRILMAGCAAACDCAVYRLARRWFDDGTARWALACSLLAWFNCFCAVRPFANCLEATLCAAALALWPFAPSPSAGPDPPPPPHRVAALLLGATACSLRPPIALLWAVLGLHHLLTLLRGGDDSGGGGGVGGGGGGEEHQSAGRKYHWRAAGRFLCEAVCCVLLVFGGCSVIDRVCYGVWTFPAYNFIVWNAVTGGAARYGTHPWHWYVTQGLPTVLGPAITPLAIYGIYYTATENSNSSSNTAKGKAKGKGGGAGGGGGGGLCIVVVALRS
jgi:phosphatidylinositol glycan class B